MYKFLFEAYFENVPQNQRLRNIKKIKSDFLEGGYYRAEVSPELSIIIMNTLFYCQENDYNNDPEGGDEQLKWLKKQMKYLKKKNSKVIVGYHMFPNLNYYNGVQFFMNKTVNHIIQRIFYKYRDIIILNVGAHTHLNGLRVAHYHENTTEENQTIDSYYGNAIISPSVSPLFNDNPGFTTLTFEDFKRRM